MKLVWMSKMAGEDNFAVHWEMRLMWPFMLSLCIPPFCYPVMQIMQARWSGSGVLAKVDLFLKSPIWLAEWLVSSQLDIMYLSIVWVLLGIAVYRRAYKRLLYSWLLKLYTFVVVFYTGCICGFHYAGQH